MTTVKKGFTLVELAIVIATLLMILFALFNLFSLSAQDESRDAQTTTREHESPIWTVTGPFEAQGSQGSAGNMFLLDHPTLGRRMVSSKEIAGLEGSESGVKREIPYAVVERDMNPGCLYAPVLWARK